MPVPRTPKGGLERRAPDRRARKDPPPPLGEHYAAFTRGPEPCPEAASVFGLVFGFDAPLRGEKRIVPVLGVRNLLFGAVGENTRFDGSLDTHVARTSLRFDLDPGVHARVPLSATYQWAQLAPLRYEGGERLADLEVNANRLSAGLELGFETAPGVEVAASAAGSRLAYWRAEGAAEGLVLPPDHDAWVFQLGAAADRMRYFQNWEIAEGFEVGITAQYAVRRSWRAWGLPGEPQTRPAENREYACAFGFARWSLRFDGDQELRLSAEGGLGDDLDVLSAFRLGSLVGDLQVPGYYFGEIQCDRYLLLGVRYALNVGAGGRLWVSGKAGATRGLDGIARGVLGVSLGMTQELFWRVSLLAEYGFSPVAERPGALGGHELRAGLRIGPMLATRKTLPDPLRRARGTAARGRP